MIGRLSPRNSVIEFGELAQKKGEYLEAASAFEAALQNPDPLVVANAHNCLGKLAWRQGAYDASLAAFEKARAIALSHDAVEARARAEIGLGLVFYARGDYARARDLYNGVRTLSPSPGIRGKALLNLGIIANIEGDIPGAERQYRAACQAFAEAADTHGQAQAHHNLGMLHADRLEWDEADAAYAEALRLCAEADEREMVGLVTMNMAELSCATGQHALAVTRCDAALAIFAEIGAEALRGTTLRWKGRALRELGLHQASERALTESVRIARRAQAKLLEAESMRELGATLTLAGNHGAARKWLRRAHDLFVSFGARREAEEVSADLAAVASEI